MQIENIPLLRLAPPAVYHEKVKKRNVPSAGESSNGLAKPEKPSRSKHLRDVKLKGSSLRFPLKTNIFGEIAVLFYTFLILRNVPHISKPFLNVVFCR